MIRSLVALAFLPAAPVTSLRAPAAGIIEGRVPFRLQRDYRRRTLAAGTSHLLVQRAARWAGHCAFEDLAAWIERGVVPAGDDVPAPDVSRLGLRWTPALRPDDPLARSAR